MGIFFLTPKFEKMQYLVIYIDGIDTPMNAEALAGSAPAGLARAGFWKLVASSLLPVGRVVAGERGPSQQTFDY